MVITNIESSAKPKKVVFDDDGEIVSETKTSKKKQKGLKNSGDSNLVAKSEESPPDLKLAVEDEEDYFSAREKKAGQKNDGNRESATQKKWYYVYPQYPNSEELLDIKDSEQMELHNICRSSYEQEKALFSKQNPSDARWLQTALHKGTAKDRANAGALLVTSNPIANLEALSTLIGFTKLSNKSSAEVIAIVTDLWKEVLLPPNRKLYSLQMRAADWKIVRKDASLSKEQQKRIFAYWHFENELKDQYFEFLKNIQQGLQTGQENNKTVSIVAAAQLLSLAPEKEQMLLTMLINKLGDPVAKIASKALHHLTEVANRHPNMCGVIVTETEKLLFRNNISDRAQHFALCYLASIAPAGRPEVCTKLVHICFSLFKGLVQKGAINNRTMQAILRCLQKAIVEAKPPAGSTEILNKEMQDTIYRLVHLADIGVSIQTLALLLQLVTVKTEKSDRFYNALYIKLADMNLATIGTKSAAQLLHIVHRAIFIDSNVPRAQAFIKRLLQLALCLPANMAAGCLIVMNKLLRSRKELYLDEKSNTDGDHGVKVSVADEELSKFDSDGEEKYEDISETEDLNDDKKKVVKQIESSWNHSKVLSNKSESKVRDINPTKYDPYHRIPAYAGAEYCLRNELILLQEHFHPTVKVFAESILNNKRIDYYGDPLRDFGLPHFLERFSFKNPKKIDQDKLTPSSGHKQYVSYGTRGMPVKSLTLNNCTEDEMFIFNYLEQKRKQSVVTKSKSSDDDDDEDENLKGNDVDDDEFEEYLDGFFGKKGSKAKKNESLEEEDEELDFLKEFEGALAPDSKQNKGKSKKKTALDEEDNVEDIDSDWGEDDDKQSSIGSELSDDGGSIDLNGNEDDDDDDESISMDEFDDNEDFDDQSDQHSDSDFSDDEPIQKKSKNSDMNDVNERGFAKKLKHSDDMSSLFAAADDFAELLEETGKIKGQGTSNAVFNTDKSSEKQLKWEEQRRSNSKSYKNKKKVSKSSTFSKKRKH